MLRGVTPIRLTAIGTLLILIGTTVLSSISPFLLLLGVGCFLWAVTQKMMPKDKYDLESLREVHAKAELEALDIPEPDADQVQCPACFNVFPSHLPVCPHCKRAV